MVQEFCEVIHVFQTRNSCGIVARYLYSSQWGAVVPVDQSDIFHQALDSLPFEVVDDQRQRLWQYMQLLNHWNRVYNLTAITDFEHQLTHHLLDSLVVIPYIKPCYLLDVGTGAGLPGIPLAIMWPDQPVVLLDSNGKKTRFLVQVVSELGLKRVKVVHARSQSYRPDHLFDAIITRAVATISETHTNTHHLLMPHGRYWFMKGQYPTQEMDEVSAEIKVHALAVPGLEQSRHLIELMDIKQ